jgi:glucose-1-phosphate cytidylyltransferase
MLHRSLQGSARLGWHEDSHRNRPVLMSRDRGSAVIQPSMKPERKSMKVVLFCGGLGMRLRDYSHQIPKPMVPIGGHPLIWHVMKYYACFGHRDFILCLGHQAIAVKEYFLSYNECRSNDFILSEGGRKIDLLRKDIEDWHITFVDTGLHSSVGERLRRVAPLLRGEETFLANYSDGVSDLPLDLIIEHRRQHDSIASFLSVRPNISFHSVTQTEDDIVTEITAVGDNLWINGGFFVLRHDIFDFMRVGEELVLEPFERLIQRRKLSTLRYSGFWRCVDTFKDLQALESLHETGEAPWEIWRKDGTASAPIGALHGSIAPPPAPGIAPPLVMAAPTDQVH